MPIIKTQMVVGQNQLYIGKHQNGWDLWMVTHPKYLNMIKSHTCRFWLPIQMLHRAGRFNQHFPSKIASCVSNYTIITWSINMGWLAWKSQCLLQRLLNYLYSETGATNNPTKVGIEWILVLVGNHWSVNGYMAPVQWFRILSHWLIDRSAPLHKE